MNHIFTHHIDAPMTLGEGKSTYAFTSLEDAELFLDNLRPTLRFNPGWVIGVANPDFDPKQKPGGGNPKFIPVPVSAAV